MQKIIPEHIHSCFLSKEQNMTDPRNYPSIHRVSNLGRGVLLAALGLSLSNPLWAETVNVSGMNNAANYANTDIVNTLGKAVYNHTGTILELPP